MRSIDTIDLMEGVSRAFERTELSRRKAIEIFKCRKLEVTFPSPINDFKYQLCSKDTVGQIPIGRDLVIRVAPKVPIRNLFYMLEVAYRLKSFELQEGIVDVESLPELYERLASILARRVLERARKGLYRSYLDERANLQYVRGRVDVRETTKILAGGSPALHCHFQDHTADLEENQILLWTLRLLSRIGLKRPRVLAEVRAARRALSGAAKLRPVSAKECIKRLYNRLNLDYRAMHGLCRFFLEGAGPGLARGQHDLVPFTVNMPRLFELFVAEWLKRYAPPGIGVKAQHKVQLTPGRELSFNMDVVLTDRVRREPIAVLDTKYKTTIQPDVADVQQVVAYAVELGIRRAVLIYPTPEVRNQRFFVGPVEVECLPFDLASDIDQAGMRLVADLGLQVTPAESSIHA